MRVTVWKYPLKLVDGPQVVALPMGAQVRSVGPDGAVNIAIWAEVDAHEERVVKRIFEVVPTNGDVPLGWTYVGIAVTGPFIWHIYIEPVA